MQILKEKLKIFQVDASLRILGRKGKKEATGKKSQIVREQQRTEQKLELRPVLFLHIIYKVPSFIVLLHLKLTTHSPSSNPTLISFDYSALLQMKKPKDLNNRNTGSVNWLLNSK